jgi:hypothetical protein
MNLLEQVMAFFRIRLIGSRESGEHRTIGEARVLIQVILARHRAGSLLYKVVIGDGTFLQIVRNYLNPAINLSMKPVRLLCQWVPCRRVRSCR